MQQAIVAALVWKLENEGKEKNKGAAMERSKKLERVATPLSQAAKDAGVAHAYILHALDVIQYAEDEVNAVRRGTGTTLNKAHEISSARFGF